MYYKKCPTCGENSYSSDGKGSWRCPICKSDISQIKAKLTDNMTKKRKYANVDEGRD